MEHVQTHGERAVRSMLQKFARSHSTDGKVEISAEDTMDDGTPIKLGLSIDTQGSATFDFTQTGPQVYGNWNAPRAITTACILYCLRLLIEEPIPLNSGCMVPITIKLEQGSLLAPDDHLAVCAGNVLTSQRITDVILRAFQSQGCSYGCMNNLTFGDASATMNDAA